MSIIKSINSILINYGIQEIDISDITVTNNTVSDLVKKKKVLSNAIIDKIWPSIDQKIVYHYTSKKAAEAAIPAIMLIY